MKKLLLLTAAAALSLCACNDYFVPFYKKYEQVIKEELKATDYAYIYHEAEPKKDNAYIIEFYVFQPIVSISTWYCTKVSNEPLYCECLKIIYS